MQKVTVTKGDGIGLEIMESTMVEIITANKTENQHTFDGKRDYWLGQGH